MVLIAMNPNKERHVWHGSVRAKIFPFIFIFMFFQRYQMKNLKEISKGMIYTVTCLFKHYNITVRLEEFMY